MANGKKQSSQASQTEQYKEFQELLKGLGISSKHSYEKSKEHKNIDEIFPD